GLLRRWEVCAQRPRGALLFADLDGFKAMNDTRGHLAGDDFLRDLARLLRRVAEPGTVVARYGGDEFLLVVPGAKRDQAAQLRSRIVREVRRHVEHLPPPRPTLSIGIALWPEDGRDLPALIQAADQRMYQYKRRRVALALTSKGTAQGRLPAGFFEGWLTNSPDGPARAGSLARPRHQPQAFRRAVARLFGHYQDRRPPRAAGRLCGHQPGCDGGDGRRPAAVP